MVSSDISRSSVPFPPSSPLLSYYTTIYHNNLNLPSPRYTLFSHSRPPQEITPTMSMKRSKDEAEAPHTAIIPSPPRRPGHRHRPKDDAWGHIVSFVGAKTLTILACACKTTRDAAVFRDVADGSFSLMPTTELHLVELAKKDGYNAYFQDLFASPRRSRLSPHLKWEGLFTKLGDIGTLKGKVPAGVTAGVLRLLRYGSRAQLEALAKLAGGGGLRRQGLDS